MSFQISYQRCEYLLKGRRCRISAIAGEKFCVSCIVKTECQVAVSEGFKSKFIFGSEWSEEKKVRKLISKILPKANVISYEVHEMKNFNHMITLNFTLETDIGDFDADDVFFTYDINTSKLITIFRAGFGRILKELLIDQIDKCKGYSSLKWQCNS